MDGLNTILNVTRNRLRGLFRRENVLRDIEEEMRVHIEMDMQSNIARGMSTDEANAAALKRFGNRDRMIESGYRVRGGGLLETISLDLRYGVRMLWKSPTFTIVAILTLALGLGVNAAIFGIVDSFLFRPLPVEKPNELIVLAFQKKQGPLQDNFSYTQLDDLQNETADVFSDVTGSQYGLDGMGLNGNADRIVTCYVSGNFFTMLGIKPVVGRFIFPSEGKSPQADPVIVLGYTYWKSRFNANPAIIGQKVLINGHPVTVIGVAPKGFHGMRALYDVQGYLPFAMCVTLEGLSNQFLTNRGIRNILILARLKPGVSVHQAQAAMKIVAGRFAQQYPDSDEGMSLNVYPEIYARPRPQSGSQTSSIASLFLILAVVVLLLACINVANLLLVRSTIREREMAIRLALGAGRARLVRQLLTESVALALIGGAAGILLGSFLTRLLSSIPIQTDDAPFTFDLGYDWRVFAYAFSAALIAGIVMGIVPALRASPISPAEVLQSGGARLTAGRNRLRNGLVVAEVGASLMLLIVAGLFSRSLSNAQRVDLGFDPNNVLNLSTDPEGIGYKETEVRSFYKELLARAKSLPGVESASLSSAVPLGDINFDNTILISGYVPLEGQPMPLLEYSVVSPEYFQNLKIPLLVGRGFTDADRQETQHVAVVNQAMAERFWPNTNAIGRTFAMSTHLDNTFHVVGVVKNCRNSAATGPIEPFFYIPLEQNYTSLETLEIRTTAAPETVSEEAQKAIADIAPGLPVFNVRTMKKSLGGMRGFLMFRLGAGLAASIGLLGLALAVVGVYGVISYSTSQRTHEIGVRMALGARQGAILKMILQQGFLLVGTGITAGILAAVAVSRLVDQFLVGVTATDPLTYSSVTIILVMVALVACYLPARRGTRVDPMVALRHE